MNKIWIIGSSGFAFTIGAQFSLTPGEGNILGGFIDSRSDALEMAKAHCKRIGLEADFLLPEELNFQDPKNRFLFGVGDPQFKKEFFSRYQIPPESMHRFEQAPDISRFSETLPSIYWGCSISANAIIGYGCYIDRNTVIGHDVQVGNFCHIAVGVIIGGSVTIGEASYIHSGAIIGNNVNIGENCTVGVGAVVLRNLRPGTKIISPKSLKLS